MKTEKQFFLEKYDFNIFKIILWVCTGFFFVSFSIIIPTTSYNIINELMIFLGLMIVINFHTSYLYQKVSKKNKFLYIVLAIITIFICVLFEILVFSNSIHNVYSNVNKRKILLFISIYISIRDSAFFVFFFWLEHFNRLILLYKEKDVIHRKEIAFLNEKQEFEKKFSRKKLLPHYFFNILEHINVYSLKNKNNNELIDKLKFVLYYFLVDAEMEKIELEKEITFYKYYIELEKFRYKNNISVNFNFLGQSDNYEIIPLLFEPLIGNALKYTKHDGSGWVDITLDTSNFPILKFQCKNNYTQHTPKITSSESGLKIFEQRLNLCYDNKHSLSVIQNTDLYEVTLFVDVK